MDVESVYDISVRVCVCVCVACQLFLSAIHLYAWALQLTIPSLGTYGAGEEIKRSSGGMMERPAPARRCRSRAPGSSYHPAVAPPDGLCTERERARRGSTRRFEEGGLRPGL